MARGLVEVDVDRHHEVELVEGGGEALPVGHGEHWIAGQRHHRADLAQTRGLDLVCKHGGGQIPERLGQATHTALPTVVAIQAAHARDATDVEGRRREHRSALATEPSRYDVQQVGGEGRGRGVRANAHADARVAYRRACVGELERKTLDDIRRHAGEGGDSRRGERGQASLDLGPSIGRALYETTVKADELD